MLFSLCLNNSPVAPPDLILMFIGIGFKNEFYTVTLSEILSVKEKSFSWRSFTLILDLQPLISESNIYAWREALFFNVSLQVNFKICSHYVSLYIVIGSFCCCFGVGRYLTDQTWLQKYFKNGRLLQILKEGIGSNSNLDVCTIFKYMYGRKKCTIKGKQNATLTLNNLKTRTRTW